MFCITYVGYPGILIISLMGFLPVRGPVWEGLENRWIGPLSSKKSNGHTFIVIELCRNNDKEHLF